MFGMGDLERRFCIRSPEHRGGRSRRRAWPGGRAGRAAPALPALAAGVLLATLPATADLGVFGAGLAEQMATRGVGTTPGDPTRPPAGSRQEIAPVGLDATGTGMCPDGAPVAPCLFVYFHGLDKNANSLDVPGDPHEVQLGLHQLIFTPPRGSEPRRPEEAFVHPLRAAGCDVLYGRWDGSSPWTMDLETLARVTGPIRQEIEARDAEAGEPVRVYLHGQSAGGLVVSWILSHTAEDPDAAFIASRLTRATAVASPIGGSVVADTVMHEPSDVSPGGTLLEDVPIQKAFARLFRLAQAPRLLAVTSKAMQRRWAEGPVPAAPIGLIGAGLWDVPYPSDEAHLSDYQMYFFGATLGHNGPGQLARILERDTVMAGIFRRLAGQIDPPIDPEELTAEDVFDSFLNPDPPPPIYDPAARVLHLNLDTIADLGPGVRQALQRMRSKLTAEMAGAFLVSHQEVERFVDFLFEALKEPFDYQIDLSHCGGASLVRSDWWRDCREGVYAQIDPFIAEDGPLLNIAVQACKQALGWPEEWWCRNKIKKKVRKWNRFADRWPRAEDLPFHAAGRLAKGARRDLACTDGVNPCISNLGELLAEPGARGPAAFYPLGFIGVNHVRTMFNVTARIATFDPGGVLLEPEGPLPFGEWYLDRVICDGAPIPEAVLAGEPVTPDLDVVLHHCTYDECANEWEDNPQTIAQCEGTLDGCVLGGSFELDAYRVDGSGGCWGVASAAELPPRHVESCPCEPLACPVGECGLWPDGCGGTLDCGPCHASCPKGECACSQTGAALVCSTDGVCPDGTPCGPE